LGTCITGTAEVFVDLAVAIVIKVIAKLGSGQELTYASGFPLPVVTSLCSFFAVPLSCGSSRACVTGARHTFIDLAVAIVIKAIAKLLAGYTGLLWRGFRCDFFRCGFFGCGFFGCGFFGCGFFGCGFFGCGFLAGVGCGFGDATTALAGIALGTSTISFTIGNTDAFVAIPSVGALGILRADGHIFAVEEEKQGEAGEGEKKVSDCFSGWIHRFFLVGRGGLLIGGAVGMKEPTARTTLAFFSVQRIVLF
jgi:hypothetical protein